MQPAKCKTCGAIEWRHICGGSSTKVATFDAIPGERGKVIRVKVDPLVIKDKTPLISKPKVMEVLAKAAKFDRASYMRDRHAKRKATTQA